MVWNKSRYAPLGETTDADGGSGPGGQAGAFSASRTTLVINVDLGANGDPFIQIDHI